MKKGFIVLVAIAILFVQTVSVLAVTEDTEDNSSKISAKEKENNELTEKITKLNSDIETAKLKIAELNKKIDDSNKTLNNLNGTISSNKEKLKSRIRAIYMAGGASNIEILMGAKDFDDLLDKMEYISIISEHDSKLIDELSDDVNIEKKAKKVLESSLKELEDSNKSMTEQKEEFMKVLDENKEELNVLYDAQGTSNNLEDSEEYQSLQKKIDEYYNPEKSTEEPTKKSSSSKNSSSSKKSPSNSSSKTSSSKIITSNDKNQSSSNNNTSSSSTPNTGIIDENPDISSSGYIWPVTGFYHLTSLWNEDRYSYNHGAIDIASAGIEDQNVISAHSGTVIFANNDCIHNWGKSESCGCGGGYGNYVMLDHGDGHMTVYAHMSSITVSTGDTVEAGQLLGFVGSTGDSTGAHLHFETRLNNEKYNPLIEYPDIDVTY